MMTNMRAFELNDMEMNGVTGGVNLDKILGIVSDAVSDAWDVVSDAAGTVVDVVEYVITR